MSIAYSEELGSPRETVTDSGIQAVRTLRCAWGDRWALVEQIVGGLDVYENNESTNALARTASIRPDGARVTGGGAESQIAEYQQALVDVTYATAGIDFPDSDNGDQVAESLEPNIEGLPIAVEDEDGEPIFRWGNATTGTPLSPNEAPPKLFPAVDYVLKRFKVSAVPAATLTLVGHVNASSVVSLTLGATFGAQTLLYNPPILTRTFTSGGVGAWDIEYRFSFRPSGWNQFYRGETAQFESIFRDAGKGGGEYNPYPTGNFSLL